MTNYHYGDNITQHGSYNIGKIQNNAPVDPQAAFREMIQAVQVLRTQVSPADREAIDAAVATVTSAEPGEGAFRRALREIAGVASVVGQVGAPVIDAVQKVTTALGL
ncbi:hypothetical protein [Nonomuraea sp. NPDC050310]|uniref:hypothetical protein n=1 Tax=Nonomuraea sp. NPDC050310 TaxID=3154935 RepID=UPI0033DD73F3